MSELSEAQRPTKPTSGRPCGGGQLLCKHYGPCGDHCADNRFDCSAPTIGWRWYYDVAEWVPVCERHFYVRGLRGDYRLSDDKLLKAA